MPNQSQGLQSVDVALPAAVLEARTKFAAAVCDQLMDNQTNVQALAYCAATLLYVFNNILRHPTDSRYRQIRTASFVFQRTIAALAGGTRLLKLAGFRPKTIGSGEYWALEPDSLGTRVLLECRPVLRGAIHVARMRTQRARHHASTLHLKHTSDLQSGDRLRASSCTSLEGASSCSQGGEQSGSVSGADGTAWGAQGPAAPAQAGTPCAVLGCGVAQQSPATTPACVAQGPGAPAWAGMPCAVLGCEVAPQSLAVPAWGVQRLGAPPQAGAAEPAWGVQSLCVPAHAGMACAVLGCGVVLQGPGSEPAACSTSTECGRRYMQCSGPGGSSTTAVH